jgi:Domain of unknown function (DUF4190)
MQPGNPEQDPYGQQNPNDPTGPYDPHRQQPQPPPQQPYGQPGAGEPQYGQPGPGQPQYPPAPGYPAPGYGGGPGDAGGRAPNNNLGLVALVLGIAAIPFGLCCGLFGTPFGIAAIVVGYLGKTRADQGQATNRGQAMTGVILGAVGIVLAIINVAIGQLVDWREFTNTN